MRLHEYWRKLRFMEIALSTWCIKYSRATNIFVLFILILFAACFELHPNRIGFPPVRPAPYGSK